MKVFRLFCCISLTAMMICACAQNQSLTAPKLDNEALSKENFSLFEDKMYFSAAIDAIERNEIIKAKEYLDYIIKKYPSSTYYKPANALFGLIDALHSCETKKKKAISDIEQLKKVDIEASKQKIGQ
ncbi:MAG: hypothetical protein WCJ49_05970 [Deltaproteobacteria bacterium]